MWIEVTVGDDCLAYSSHIELDGADAEDYSDDGDDRSEWESGLVAYLFAELTHGHHQEQE